MGFLDDQVIAIPARRIIFTCGFLPLFALAVCVLTAVTAHFDRSTRTHCGVRPSSMHQSFVQVTNWLPSISSAIGGYTPERYIWRISIALHCAPRFIVGFLYRNMYRSCPLRSHVDKWWLDGLCNLLAALHVVENAALLGLSMISSVEEHFVHAACFTVFIASSTAYMALNTYLFDHSGRRRSFSQGELSFQYKSMSLMAMLTALALALYFYYRHNTYCEPGVYSLFALCEYSVVVCNIVYHWTISLDMHDKQFCVMSVHGMDSLLPLVSPSPYKDT